MSLYLPWKTATITIATSATTSDEVNLENNADLMQVIFPALTACTVKVQVSNVTGGTFVDLGNAVTTASSTGSYATTFRLGGYQYIKLVCSQNQAADRSILVRGMKY